MLVYIIFGMYGYLLQSWRMFGHKSRSHHQTNSQFAEWFKTHSIKMVS